MLTVANSNEEILLSCDAQGDEKAFVQIIRPYQQALANYIRYRISDAEDAEDVFQETLVAAWLGLRRVRDPGSIRAWLMQVARNRCRDYFRAQGRQDVPAGERELEDFANRFGLHQYRHAQTVADVVEALEEAPKIERETARQFYLEGLTIAEIAAQARCPSGTVKRRLFQARHSLRAFLGIISPQRSSQMSTQTSDTPPAAAQAPAFPLVRPEITITKINEPPFAVDCLELRYWVIIPRLGARASPGRTTARPAGISARRWKRGFCARPGCMTWKAWRSRYGPGNLTRAGSLPEPYTDG